MDTSRVFTSWSRRRAPDAATHIGLPKAHHPISHHGDTREGIAKYAKLTTYHAAKLSEFIGKLQETKDGDASLLDRSVIYFGSGMGNGNAHDRNNPSDLLMGGANGKLKGNRPLKMENKEPTANLFLARGRSGAEVPSTVKSTGQLSL